MNTDDSTLRQNNHPTMGDVSYVEAGHVGFSFLVLHSQADKILEALDGGDEQTAKDLLESLRSSLGSSEQHLPAARRMTAWLSTQP